MTTWCSHRSCQRLRTVQFRRIEHAVEQPPERNPLGVNGLVVWGALACGHSKTFVTTDTQMAAHTQHQAATA